MPFSGHTYVPLDHCIVRLSVQQDDLAKDQEILDAEAIPKPEKPKLMTDAEARQKIVDRFNEIRRKPGEPKIHFELTNGTPITATNVCPR